MDWLWSHLWASFIPALFFGFALSLIESACRTIARPINLHIFGVTMSYWLLSIVFDNTAYLQQLFFGAPLPRFFIIVPPALLLPAGLLAWLVEIIVRLYQNLTGRRR